MRTAFPDCFKLKLRRWKPNMRIWIIVLFALIRRNEALTKRASLTYKHGEVQLRSDKGKDVVLEPGRGGRVRINGLAQINGALLSLKLNTAKNQRCTKANKGVLVYRNGAMEICDGSRFVSMNAKLGSLHNPASSCKAILEDDWSAPSGAYYIKTEQTTTKVYCYMEDIPGCGGGGWTTVMKTNGHMVGVMVLLSLISLPV
ncbi:hypothetical protein AC249_AIPGENE11704 [Exaiptasia diaphana]|nr:hypothetical protein AC249_AIPGENE11704 [Exaiptasia diaphana]